MSTVSPTTRGAAPSDAASRDVALTIGSLFSGIGGLDLAVEAVTGGRVAWHSETDPYAAHVLALRWPGVPNLGDIRSIVDPPAVDVMCGGFPCQDISTAGKGKGLDGKRSGLWWEFHRLVRDLGPGLVVVENVEALRSRGLDTVVGSLAGLGFVGQWTSLSAANVGATHRRRRLFILAHRDRSLVRQLAERQQYLAAQCRHTVAPHPGLDVANPGHYRCQGCRSEHDLDGRDASWNDPHRRGQGLVFPPSPDDGQAWVQWLRAGGPVPGVRRSAHGPAAGVDARRRRGRVRCLGNGVVPRQAAAALRLLIARADDELSEVDHG